MSNDRFHVEQPVRAELAEERFSPEGPPKKHREASKVSRWLAVGAAVVLVIGPVLGAWAPAEIARWYDAAATERRLEGDLDGAIDRLGKAVAWNDDHGPYYYQRAQWKMEAGDYQGALADAERAIELLPDAYEPRIARATIYQHLGEHEKAIADWKRLDRLSAEAGMLDRSMTLNGLAYARAVAGVELEQALGNVNTAIERSGNVAAFLDTRAYIQYLRGNYEEALEDQERAVKLAREEHAAMQQLIASRRHTVEDPRQLDLQMRRRAESLAVLYYHRALIYGKLEKSEAAEQDLDRVRQLGFEPGPELF